MPSIITYNQTNIASWEAELAKLHRQLDEKLAESLRLSRALEPLASQLRSLDSQISSVNSQIFSQQLSDMSRHSHSHGGYHGHSHHHGHGHHSSHHQSTLGTVLHVVGDVASAYNMSSLQSQLSRLNAERALVASQISPLEGAMAACSADIRTASTRKTWIEQHIPAARRFLDTLHHSPAELIDTLKNDILRAFSKYYDDHPVGRSLQVRMCLFNINAKLDALSLSGDASPQLTYLRLNALLWEMYRKVAMENIDTEFKNLLEGFLESTHIVENGDLPDTLATGSSAQAHLDSAKRANASILNIIETDFLRLEQQLFAQYIQQARMQAQYCTHPFLGNKIYNALYLIDAEIQRNQQEGKAVDYHFYTRAVCDLGNVAASPQNLAAGRRLAKLTEVASGAPDMCKQVVGGLAIVVGVLLIAASITGLVFTLGGSSFASAFGVALGMSLLSSQITLGIGGSLVGAAGLGMTFFGERKRESGLRQGLSQEFDEISDGVLNPSKALPRVGAIPVPLAAVPVATAVPVPLGDNYEGSSTAFGYK